MDDPNGSTSIREVIKRRSDVPDVNPDADVFIKAEFHYSEQDLQEELELIRTGEFDAVMFEVAREEVEEITKISIWNWVVGLLFFLMGPLYTNSTPLIAATGSTGTTPYYTREKDGDVIQDLSPPIPTLIASLWVLCLILTALFGAAEGGTEVAGFYTSYTYLSILSFLGALGLPVIVRVVRNNIGGNQNRNAIIAKKIVNTNAESGKTLVILGNKHADKVGDQLPDGITVSSIPVSHHLLSKEGLRTFVPGAMKLLLLFAAIWLLIETVGGTILVILLSLLV